MTAIAGASRLGVGGARADLDAIQAWLTNRLDVPSPHVRHLCGIIGERPSGGARSPALWNAAFADLDYPAVYLPFDVPRERLPGLLDVLRAAPGFLGGSVATPYKTAVLGLLDEVDPAARLAGAVNVIVRTAEGSLLGGNTDGAGALAALTCEAPDGSPPLMRSLAGARVLVLGAGGAARAVASAVGPALAAGTLYVANRSVPRGAELAGTLAAAGVRATAVGEPYLPKLAREIDVIVNCSAKGQAGWQTLDDGRQVTLEPYSALAPASPEPIGWPSGHDATRRRTAYAASLPDILRNADAGARAALAARVDVPFFDAVYAPRESVFLQQGRLSGHRTLNGIAMSVAQASDALVHWVCRPLLEARGQDSAEAHGRVRAVMGRLW